MSFMKGSMHLKVHMTFTFSVHSHIRHKTTQDMGKETLVKKQGAGSVSALPMCMGSHPHIPSRGRVLQSKRKPFQSSYSGTHPPYHSQPQVFESQFFSHFIKT